MPYGVRRAIKAPGEYGFGDLAALGLSSAGGIFAALATDFSQKGENSALYKINEWVVAAGRNFGAGDMPLWGVALGLVGFGAVSIFYFQPLTRLGAFARGFGLLAAAMTATPTDLVSGIQGARRIALPRLLQGRGSDLSRALQRQHALCSQRGRHFAFTALARGLRQSRIDRLLGQRAAQQGGDRRGRRQRPVRGRLAGSEDRPRRRMEPRADRCP